MRTCIIRIYREERDDPRSLVGVIEEVGHEGRKAFSNLEELCEVLKAKEEKGGPAKGDEKGKR